MPEGGSVMFVHDKIVLECAAVDTRMARTGCGAPGSMTCIFIRTGSGRASGDDRLNPGQQVTQLPFLADFRRGGQRRVQRSAKNLVDRPFLGVFING
jgi:hypothetical protein